MKRQNQSQERPLYAPNSANFLAPQAKNDAEDFENNQSPLETKNTTFSFQDYSALINKSINENNIVEKSVLSPLLSHQSGQSFLLQQKKIQNVFHLKLRPLVLPVNKRQSSQEILPQVIDKVSSPDKLYQLQKKNSIISQEALSQQSLILQRVQTMSEFNEQNEEVSSPVKQRLQYLTQKNTIDFNSEEDVNWIIRIAKKNHKTKMELAYFRKFAYYFPQLEQQLKNVDKDNISQEIFNQFKFTMYNPNRVLSKCDDTLYIVLKGSLALMEKNSILDLSIEQYQLQNKFISDEDYQKIQSEEQLPDSNTDIFTNHENYTTIKKFLPGESFGEIRLFENSPLKGIVVTETECQMIEITKEGIQSILAKYKASEQQEQIDFFKSFSFFKDIPVYDIMSLIKQSNLKEFTRGDTLYQENDLSNCVFFIKNGEVEISKLIEQESNTETQTINNRNSQIIIPIQNLQNSNQNSNVSPLLKRNPKRGEMIPLKYFQNNKKRISLKILTQNSYFGQEEILQKITKRVNKAVVLSPQAQIYIVNFQDFMQLIQKHSQLQTLMEENQLKELAEEQRKKLIKKVQVKIQNRQSQDQIFFQSKTSCNTPKSSQEIRSPLQRQQTSILNYQKPHTHRGYTQQFSSLVFDNSNNKSGIIISNNSSNLKIPLQNQNNNLENRESLDNFTSALYIKQNIKTQPNSYRGSPKVSQIEKYLVSPPIKKEISRTNSSQQFFSDPYENQTGNVTERIQNQNNQQQYQSDYSLSPILKKQISRNLPSPQIIKLQSGQNNNNEIIQSAHQRSFSQQQSQQFGLSASKTITSFKAFDYDNKKKGNMYDQNGNPILMIQFKTDSDTQTAMQKNIDEYQIQSEKKSNKTLNLRAIFKSPILKIKDENNMRASTSRFNEQEDQKTIRNNEVQDKNQKVYYDLSPIKKQILKSLIETNKQNKFNQNNHYNKSVSPMRQLPTHPEILSNIPKKFWKDNQKILDKNELMVKEGSVPNKRHYQRAGRQSDLTSKSLLDRNMDKIMQIARQQTQISPRFNQNQNEEYCQMNIGIINVQNLECQLKKQPKKI